MNVLNLGTQANGQPLLLPLSALDRHVQIAGPTGTGKTRLLVRLFQQLVDHTDACIVALDPKGGMHRLLKRWCYSKALDDRMLVIDPNDRRMVCGFNPVQPWADNHDLQVRVARELILRAMGQNEALATPRMSRWLDNILHVLIEMRLTLAEALLLLPQIKAKLPYVHISGGDLRQALTDGVDQGYREGFLRASIVERPFSAAAAERSRPLPSMPRFFSISKKKPSPAPMSSTGP